MNGPTFKCSCPSRKFPCKHGLYLLSTAVPALFAGRAEPQWVGDWLSSRQVRQEKRADNAVAVAQDPAVAAAAQAQARKREEKHEDKIDAGVRELQTWLHDLAREGLVAVRSRCQGMWDGIAARMVDDKAAPLARRLRRAGGFLYQSGLHSADSLVANELASIYLLTQTWQRLGHLPLPCSRHARPARLDREPGRGAAPTRRRRLLAYAGADRFDDERLRVRATWLHGPDARWALLQYAAGAQGFEQQLAPGTEFDGELCFYPSAYPLRAQFRRQDKVRALAHIGTAPTMASSTTPVRPWPRHRPASRLPPSLASAGTQRRSSADRLRRMGWPYAAAAERLAGRPFI